MKQCAKCLIIKEENNFSKYKQYPDGLSYWCIECWKQYRKIYYNNDLKASRKYTNDRRAERIQWIQLLKSNTPCIDCGLIYEPCCMDYDHIANRGNKIKNISGMISQNFPKEIILEEINKCDLVCLLCHNKRTQNRFNETLGLDRKYKKNQQRNINIINNFKNKQCCICNIQYEIYNMQIDHVDPSTKLYNICQLKNYKEEILLIELAKCQVLCALCHRLKSILEQKDGKYLFTRVKPPKKQKLFYDSITNNKECGICHKIKESSKFRINKNKSCGLDSYCKECFYVYRKERRKK